MHPLGRRTRVLNTSHGDHQPTETGSIGSVVTDNGRRRRGREVELAAMDGGDEVFLFLCCDMNHLFIVLCFSLMLSLGFPFLSSLSLSLSLFRFSSTDHYYFYPFLLLFSFHV